MDPNESRLPTKGNPQRQVVESTPYDAVTGFYRIDGASLALRRSQFDIEEEISTLVGHIRDSDPKVSLPALRQFRSVLREVALTSGLIGTVRETRTQTTEGNTTRQAFETNTLLSKLKDDYDADRQEDHEETPSALEIFGPNAITEEAEDPEPDSE